MNFLATPRTEVAKDAKDSKQDAKEGAKKDGSAAAAWEPFARLLSADTAALADAGYDKFTTPAKYFLFGDTDAFMNGLPGMLEGGIFRSMAQEARFNEDGKWWPEYEHALGEPTSPPNTRLPGKRWKYARNFSSGRKPLPSTSSARHDHLLLRRSNQLRSPFLCAPFDLSLSLLFADAISAFLSRLRRPASRSDPSE